MEDEKRILLLLQIIESQATQIGNLTKQVAELTAQVEELIRKLDEKNHRKNSKNSRQHINWNWAGFEWMYEHPEFDKDSKETIGLWWGGGKIVGAAIYDMYFGEAFCGVLPEYAGHYGEVLEYAWRALKDNSGLGIAICRDGLLNAGTYSHMHRTEEDGQNRFRTKGASAISFPACRYRKTTRRRQRDRWGPEG